MMRALLVGATLAAVAEAASAAARGGLDGVGIGTFVLAGAGTFGLAAALFVPPALVAGLVLSAADLHLPVRAFRDALGRGDRARASLASMAGVAWLAIAIPQAAILTRRWFASAGANVAATLGVVAAVAAIGSSLAIAGLASRLAARARALPAVVPRLEPLVLGVMAAATCNALVPDEHAVALDAAIAGLVVARLPGLRARLARVVGSPGVWLATGASMVVAPLAMGAMPSEKQLAVLHHAPFASIALGTVQALVARIAPSPAAAEPAAAGPSPVAPPPLAESTFAPPTDIVLVHLDAVRPDHLGFAGYGRSTSPAIDRFRAQATWFERAYTSQPSTLAAIASIFTGQDASRIAHRRGPGPDYTLSSSTKTVPARLATAGYDRVAVTMPYVHEHLHGIGEDFRIWRPAWPVADDRRLRNDGAARTTDAALAHLRELEGGDRHAPFLLFVHYECAHGPYVRHAEHAFGTALVDRYDEALAYCDRELGRLLEALEHRRDRTAVVLYSDHGELLGEHGYGAHGATLLEPDVRVLLLVRVPGGAPGIVRTPVVLSDLAPTVLALAGLDGASESGAWSLLPFIASAEERLDRPIFLYRTATRGPLRIEAHGVVKDGRKYIRTDPDLEELYELERDPEENTNLVSNEALRSLRDPLARLVEARRARP